MSNTSHPDHDRYAREGREVKLFEEEYGDDWEGTMIEYDRDFVSLPGYMAKAAHQGDLRTVVQWLHKGNSKERANAKYKEGANMGLLIVNPFYLAASCQSKGKHFEAVPLLLSWGAELFDEGKQITSQEKKELWGRRCEITSAPKPRDDLVGKTCVAEEYIKEFDQYKVQVEFTNEVLLLGSDRLKLRDRTPLDPGYYVESENNRLLRRDFKSNEECQAFIACLGVEKEERLENDPDAEAKAEQAAADLLAELGMEDLEGPSSNATKKKEKRRPAATVKKKKRGGKKKGRK
ncbi:hypothetical protein THAOC_07880 [Thalassiosira oceanica]|uniref:Uncharacterized protein n=1 Tax=Thalassiosira oceanica TaxID=159749 RepID=K0SWH7_THAOC|nr:hypothetical protein THAOC_07880 [Thalassiosira oceanica]|eukprot:EJK70738.1 hypothetical protein THAOC_07880 [Thalassiosira oceanica]